MKQQVIQSQYFISNSKMTQEHFKKLTLAELLRQMLRLSLIVYLNNLRNWKNTKETVYIVGEATEARKETGLTYIVLLICEF
jgi:hypothetical protein